MSIKIKVKTGKYFAGSLCKEPGYEKYIITYLSKPWVQKDGEYQYAYLKYSKLLAVPRDKKLGHLR